MSSHRRLWNAFRLDDGPVQPGLKWRSKDRVWRIAGEFTDELLGLEPDRRVKWKQSAPWNSWAESSFEENDGRTVVHIQFEGRPTGKIWWLGPYLTVWLPKVYRDDFTLLGRILDGSD